MTPTALRHLAQHNLDAANYLNTEYDDVPALVAALHLAARAAELAAMREQAAISTNSCYQRDRN